MYESVERFTQVSYDMNTGLRGIPDEEWVSPYMANNGTSRLAKKEQIDPDCVADKKIPVLNYCRICHLRHMDAILKYLNVPVSLAVKRFKTFYPRILIGGSHCNKCCNFCNIRLSISSEP
jgi:L-lysine 2,3-aminomutase